MTTHLFLSVLTGVAVFVGLLYALWPRPPHWSASRGWTVSRRDPLTLLDAQPGDVIVATVTERYFPISYASHRDAMEALISNKQTFPSPVQVAMGDALVVQGWSLGADPVLRPTYAPMLEREAVDCQLVATHPRTGQTVYIWPHTGCKRFDLQVTGQ